MIFTWAVWRPMMSPGAEAPSGTAMWRRPFAWALIRIDGTDSALLHAVDAGSIDAVRTGLRVVPRWADEREGQITDLTHWVPEEGADG